MPSSFWFSSRSLKVLNGFLAVVFLLLLLVPSAVRVLDARMGDEHLAVLFIDWYVERWDNKVSSFVALRQDGFEKEAEIGLLGLLDTLSVDQYSNRLAPVALRIYGLLEVLYRQQGELELLLGVYEDLIGIYPQNFSFYSLRGDVLFELQLFDEALFSYATALSYHPLHQPSVEGKIRVLFALARYRDIVLLVDSFSEWNTFWLDVPLLASADAEELPGRFSEATQELVLSARRFILE